MGSVLVQSMAPFVRTAPLQYMWHTSQFCFPQGTLCFLTASFFSSRWCPCNFKTLSCNGTMERESGAAVDDCSAFFYVFWCANKRCLFVKLCMLRCSAWCETNTSIDVAAKICKNLKGIESILNILNHFTI